jgi:hypothetical protein
VSSEVVSESIFSTDDDDDDDDDDDNDDDEYREEEEQVFRHLEWSLSVAAEEM